MMAGVLGKAHHRRVMEVMYRLDTCNVVHSMATSSDTERVIMRQCLRHIPYRTKTGSQGWKATTSRNICVHDTVLLKDYSAYNGTIQTC